MGRYQDLSLDGVSPDLSMELYRFMVRLRRSEEALIDAYHPADEMRCPVHFCVGQEAMPAALSAVLEKDDYLFSHHRSHGYYLAKGAPMDALFAEMHGRETGADGGMAGSQDISMPSVNFFSGAILSGAVAIATGAALGFQLKGGKHVAVAGFGEGATDEGVFWEALNYASLRKLPVVFVCENNRYATYSDQLKRQPADNISERVATFGLETRTLFGNDVIAVYKEVRDAVARARSGQGPAFIEAYTYRRFAHVGPEDDDYVGYRPEAERQFWLEHCPIDLLTEAMVAQELLTPEGIAGVAAELDGEIAASFEFAKQSPFPVPRDWAAMNYAQSSETADALLADYGTVGDFNESQSDSIPGPY
jgi:TPP-dependent pyruvate/acetoin dehydrogenase alpha subunit